MFDCITLDLLLGGARLRCSRQIALLEVATLVLDKFGKFPGEVVWTTPTEIGLQFTKKSPDQVANRFGDICRSAPSASCLSPAHPLRVSE